MTAMEYYHRNLVKIGVALWIAVGSMFIIEYSM